MVRRHSVEDVVAGVNGYPEGSFVMVLAPVHIPAERSVREHLSILQQQGFARVHDGKEVHRIEELLVGKKALKGTWFLVLDRITVLPGDLENESRVADSAEVALRRTGGTDPARR